MAKYAKSQGKPKRPAKRVFNEAQAVDLVMQEAKRRGLDWFTPQHAYGIVGSFLQESQLKEDVINFNVRGDNGTAHGIMQWRDDRLANLKKFSQSRNADPRDPLIQISFAFEEGTPGSPYADSGSIRAMRSLQASKNIGEAAAAWVHAERPAGYKGNAWDAHDVQSRIKYAETAARAHGAGDFEPFDASKYAGSYEDFGATDTGYNGSSTGRGNSSSGGGPKYNFGVNAPFSEGVIRMLEESGFSMPDFDIPEMSSNFGNTGSVSQTPNNTGYNMPEFSYGDTTTPYSPQYEVNPFGVPNYTTTDLVNGGQMYQGPDDVNLPPMTGNFGMTNGEYAIVPKANQGYSLTFPQKPDTFKLVNPYKIPGAAYGALNYGT